MRSRAGQGPSRGRRAAAACSHVLDAIAPLKVSPVVVVVGHDGDAVRVGGGGHARRSRCRRNSSAPATRCCRRRRRWPASTATCSCSAATCRCCRRTPSTSWCACTAAWAPRPRCCRRRRRGSRPATAASCAARPTAQVRIVEDADADEDELRDRRDQHRHLLFPARSSCSSCLARLGRDNAQGEYYLTDLVEAASARGRRGLRDARGRRRRPRREHARRPRAHREPDAGAPDRPRDGRRA